MRCGRRKVRTFFWMEMLVVLVVLGVTSAIVKPRMSRGAVAAPADQAEYLLVGNLRMLRWAILNYAQDHCGQVPSGDARQVERQLLQYTDIAGRPSAIRRGPYMLGPYLRELPPLPLGVRKGQTGIALSRPGVPDNKAGWVYDASGGMIRANTLAGEKDPDGLDYTNY